MGSSDPDKAKAAEKIIVGGLFLQLIFLSVFIVTAGVFHYRMKRAPTAASQRREVRWERYLATVYIASVLILVRSVFRVIEYLQGHNGYLLTTEWFLYVFDAMLILLVVGLLNWWHPSEVAELLRMREEVESGGMGLMDVGGKRRRKRRADGVERV